ncbi:hypothetical protein AHF37_00532 [Paragonimus kellicotti]|nr:hypothetical protein AHF37_00532 [Paragonimus kellicotti]
MELYSKFQINGRNHLLRMFDGENCLSPAKLLQNGSVINSTANTVVLLFYSAIPTAYPVFKIDYAIGGFKKHAIGRSNMRKEFAKLEVDNEFFSLFQLMNNEDRVRVFDGTECLSQERLLLNNTVINSTGDSMVVLFFTASPPESQVFEIEYVISKLTSRYNYNF